ncbi:uncharacterized protein LOC127723275 [Mytilus californianus]|uniref:uncharacterized protein LOC127723275 n=1 Tax=Mytilus californianus TaxID=6549 RepID=UPI002245F2D6|nr:uncharacterized protein LOC127723275 [Mytilus californianus]
MKLVLICITVCILSAVGASQLEFESSSSSFNEIKKEVEAPKSEVAKLKSKSKMEIEFEALKSEVAMLKTKVQRYGHHHGNRCKSGTAQLGYSGKRNKSRVQYIPFHGPFYRTPALVVGMTSLDTYRKKNVRIRTTVHHLSRHGFVLKITSWANSITYNVVYTWMACPK